MAFAIGLSILKSREDAEDVVQDVFAHKVPPLLEAHPGLNAEELGKMLAVITRNLCIDRYRRRRRFPETELDTEIAMGGTGTDTESVNEPDVQTMLDGLTPRYREVLTLKYLWELTWDETASRLGLSQAGARKRADQAKKALVDIRAEAEAKEQAGMKMRSATDGTSASGSSRKGGAD